MKMPRFRRQGHHLNNRFHPSKFSNWLFLLLLLLLSPHKVQTTSLFWPSSAISSVTAAATSNSCAAEPSAAYINPKEIKNEPRTLMRAWMCHGRTHREMIEKLASAGIVKSPINKEALLKVDRKNYVHNQDYAYEDTPQPIGYGATISAPHMHAHVLEDMLPPLLQATKNYPDKPLSILDVGCGSGYLTAVFGRMVERNEKSRQPPVLNQGKVYGIDYIPQLVDLSRENIMKEDGDLFQSGTIEVAVRDGWKGYPEGAPFNAIHVGAAAETFPKDLMNQLAVGGVMVIPVGPEGGIQYLYKVERVNDGGSVVGVNDSKDFKEDDFKVLRVLGVRYVPLVRAD